MRKPVVAVIAVSFMVAAGVVPDGPAVASVAPATVYVVPGAVDAAGLRAGLSADRPVGSFEAAQSILRARGAVKARILTPGGTYYPDRTFTWTYDPPGGELVFDAMPGTGEVIFDGSRTGAGRAAAPNYYMVITASRSNITVSGRTIQRYTNGGIRISGTPGARVTGVTIKNNTFRQLGNKYRAGGIGYGGVHMTSSSKITITGNRFYNLENKTSPGAIHGVYLANASHSSRISGNLFGFISGDPIRTRNGSRDNVVDGNRFWRSGSYSVFSDWRFGKDSCGRGNVFRNNRVGRTSYYGKRFGVGKQGQVSPIKLLMWGHDAPKNANLGGCKTVPVRNGGGNTYVTKRPW